MDMHEYCTRHNITLVIREDLGLRRDEEQWEHHAYRVQLRGRSSMTVPWRQGLGISEAPTAAAVLDVLVSDVAGYLNADGYEDWCSELGMDPDDKAARGAYRQIEFQAPELVALLGGQDEFDKVTYNVEPL